VNLFIALVRGIALGEGTARIERGQTLGLDARKQDRLPDASHKSSPAKAAARSPHPV